MISNSGCQHPFSRNGITASQNNAQYISFSNVEGLKQEINVLHIGISLYSMTVDITPDSRIIGASMGAVARGFRTYRLPLEQSVRNVAIPSIAENFEVGGRPPWEPHAESTEVRRERQGTLGGEPQDILVETGRLFGDAVKLARWSFSGDEAYISNLPNRSAYGRFHQTGAVKGAVNMPRRPWATLTEDDVDQIENIFNRWRDGIIIANWWRRTRLLRG